MIKWPAWAVVGLVLLTACSSENQTDDKRVVPIQIGTSSQTGAYFSVGKAICNLLNDPTSPCKAIPTGGSIHNLESMKNGQLSLGIVQSGPLYQAWFGSSPFKEKIKNVRLLFALNEEAVTLVTQGDSDISSLQRLMGKRINTGPKGGENEGMLDELFRACSQTLSEVSVNRLDATELPRAMNTRTLDGYFEILSHPNLPLAQMALSTPLKIVPIEGECVTTLVNTSRHFEKTTISGKMYRHMEADVSTIGVKTWLVASSDLSEQAAYQIVAKIMGNLETFRKSDPLLYQLSPYKMAKASNIPYHPGAMKYYQEKNWFKPTPPPPP